MVGRGDFRHFKNYYSFLNIYFSEHIFDFYYVRNNHFTSLADLAMRVLRQLAQKKQQPKNTIYCILMYAIS